MLDPILLKSDLKVLQENLKRRNLNINLQQLVDLDEYRRKIRFEAEKLRSDQKLIGKEIASAKT